MSHDLKTNSSLDSQDVLITCSLLNLQNLHLFIKFTFFHLFHPYYVVVVSLMLLAVIDVFYASFKFYI